MQARLQMCDFSWINIKIFYGYWLALDWLAHSTLVYMCTHYIWRIIYEVGNWNQQVMVNFVSWAEIHPEYSNWSWQGYDGIAWWSKIIIPVYPFNSIHLAQNWIYSIDIQLAFAGIYITQVVGVYVWPTGILEIIHWY